MKILIAQINPIVGDLPGNQAKILGAIKQAKSEGADLLLTPELALCGYPPEDFLLLPHFVKATQEALDPIIKASKGIVAVIGTVRSDPLHNSAAVIADGKLLGYQDKMLLPTYDVFDEGRYFERGKGQRIWELCGKKVAITICEDIWEHAGVLRYSRYHSDPVADLFDLGPELLLNLSSSPYHRGKARQRIEVCQKAAQTLNCPVVMVNQVGGNDSLIFDGKSCLVTPEGLVRVAKGYAESMPLWDLDAKAKAELPADDMADLYETLKLGLADYFRKQGFTEACLGLSGGVDSALVAVLAADALGPDKVHAVAMPSRYSSDLSMTDAKQLVANLKIHFKVIPIEEPFSVYLDLLTPHFEGKPEDTTEENIQARIRGMILMALSNKHGCIVLSTGNKSEMAMGYSTLYGDLAGGLAVISDLSKGLVYDLCRYINRTKEVIPRSIIEKAPSAELRPNQKDSDSLPDYAIIDKVLDGYIIDHLSPDEIAERHTLDPSLVKDLVEKIHRNEYKRRQAPPGLRVSEKAFSVGRRFPIVCRTSF